MYRGTSNPFPYHHHARHESPETIIIAYIIRVSNNTATDSCRGGSVLDHRASDIDSLAEAILIAFSKAHKPEERFVVVYEKADKPDKDLGHVEISSRALEAGE